MRVPSTPYLKFVCRLVASLPRAERHCLLKSATGSVPIFRERSICRAGLEPCAWNLHTGSSFPTRAERESSRQPQDLRMSNLIEEYGLIGNGRACSPERLSRLALPASVRFRRLLRRAIGNGGEWLLEARAGRAFPSIAQLYRRHACAADRV